MKHTEKYVFVSDCEQMQMVTVESDFEGILLRIDEKENKTRLYLSFQEAFVKYAN